jgi:hypothetical protein
MDDGQLAALKQDLDHVNTTSGRKFEYGIFEPGIEPDAIREFFSHTTICVMRLEGEAVGFFYNVVLREASSAVIHAGLIVVAHNRGVNLVKVPYMHMALLQRRLFGSYYFTSISATPSIIGAFCDTFSGAWPNYRGNMIRPPSGKYIGVLTLLVDEYIRKHFPEGQVSVDPRRFVMRSPSSAMGFEQDMRKLARYHNLAANMFCSYWLDYSKGEDLIQIGRMDGRCELRIRLYMAWLSLTQLTRPAGRPAPKLARSYGPRALEAARAERAAAQQKRLLLPAPLQRSEDAL